MTVQIVRVTRVMSKETDIRNRQYAAWAKKVAYILLLSMTALTVALEAVLLAYISTLMSDAFAIALVGAVGLAAFAGLLIRIAVGLSVDEDGEVPGQQ